MWWWSPAAFACQCPVTPALPVCPAGHEARPAAEVLASPPAPGAPVAVAGLLHGLFGCADVVTADGACTPRCSGQAVLAVPGDPRRFVYLGDAVPSGPFACTGSTGCWCCGVDARDQQIVARGTFETGPVPRVAGATLCVPATPH